jgi:CrcB protein
VRSVLAVGCGGFVGALTRYGVSLAVARIWTRDFPLATLLINVSGSFILGFFSTWAAGRVSLDPAWRLLVGTGFVGAFTTFSTFEYETQRLTEAGAAGWALVNVLSSVAAGFLAVRLGVSLAR